MDNFDLEQDIEIVSDSFVASICTEKMRDPMLVESTTVLFDKEFMDLHDDGFDGSMDEHRIFSEVFFVSESKNKEISATEAINFDDGYVKQSVVPLCSNSGNSSLTIQFNYGKEDVSEKPASDYVSGDLTSSVKDNRLTNLTVGVFSHVKPDLKDTLILSTPSEGYVSSVSQQDSDCSCFCLTYRVVESSHHCVTSSHDELNQIVNLDERCEISGRDGCKNRFSGFDQNDLKEAVSPVSQESYASKVLLIDSTKPVMNRFGTDRPKKPRWKDHCFVKLGEDELAMPRNVKNDLRPLLRYHINRLFTAAGWEIGRRRRDKKYNGIGEYMYRSPGGRPFREFHRAWCLCGEILLTDSANFSLPSDCMQWADMAELRTDLSRTFKEIEDKLYLGETTSAMAYIWFLLDPFANAVFIDKTIRLLKQGITVKAKRSLPMPSDAGSAAKYRKISISEGSHLNVKPQQDCRSDSTYNRVDGRLYDVPICSENEPKLLEEAVNKIPHQGSSASSPSFELQPSEEGGFGYPKAHKKSRMISEMKITRNILGKRGHHHIGEINSARCGSKKFKKLNACGPSDDDLLISAMIRKKTGRSTMKWPASKSKSLRKRKTSKGSCRLLPRSFKKGAKHFTEGKWSLVGPRTILSWLIHSDVVSPKEVIQYQNPKDDTVIKRGLITRDGVLCSCCNVVLSISRFCSHAGFKLNRPWMNLFMESGKPLTICQLEAWSAEYKARKVSPQTDKVDEADQNDDSCGRCGELGELICCDGCPSAFHQACLFEQELPEGSWYCPQCRCQICGYAVKDKETSQLDEALKCAQCEHQYHRSCIQGRGIKIESASGTWFCGECCHKVYSGLQSRIGLRNPLSDGFSWTLLRCIPGDQKVRPGQLALRAECNSKLAVAITIMEECFLPMLDVKTGIDMIPQVIYNWESQFARLNYYGFYTVVLEKDDVVLSVASIRIHGTVAELPLVATCSKYRRRGMCRRLINSIEEMLKLLKVEKLLVSAIETLVETWTVGFGFEPLEEDERRSLSKLNLMVFPGSIWLKKHLFDKQTADGVGGSCDVFTSDSAGVEACKGRSKTIEHGQLSDITLQKQHSMLIVEKQEPLPSENHSAVKEKTTATDTMYKENEIVPSYEENLFEVLLYPTPELEPECPQPSDCNLPVQEFPTAKETRYSDKEQSCSPES